MPNNVSGEDYDEDIKIELAQYTEPALNSALLIRRRLNNNQINKFDHTNFIKQYKSPRKLDVGCGNVAEEGWIRLDCNERYKPDLLMDAHNILLEDQCINEIRMHYVLGYTMEPAKVLSEIWRVLVPDGKLFMINGAPASDIQLMPGIKHSFPKAFWQDVTEDNPNLYIPKKNKGGWGLIDESYDWSPTATRLASKLKLPRDVVINTFRNVASNQYITLQKIIQK
jgi:hypothetical protein